MLNQDEQEVEKYLKNLLAANDLGELDAWMQIISSAEFASSTNDHKAAESLYKLALDFAESKMSTEVIVNALLCLSLCYRKQNRTMEADVTYARAIALFNEMVLEEY